MATTTERVIQNSLGLSAKELKDLTRNSGAEWPDDLINEFLSFLANIIIIADSEGDLADRVEQNEQDIAANATQISTNSANISNNSSLISVNTSNIATNASDIATNTSNISSITITLNNHISSDSEHGVTGVNVGTGDFCTLATGGVVLLAVLVNDATQSTADILTADASAAPAAYNQAQIQEIVDLANDTKAQHNQLLSDFNDAVDTLNTLIDEMKNANQMDT